MTTQVGPAPTGQAGGMGGDTPISDALGARVRTKFEESKAARALYEEQWLRDLRQYKGIYEDVMLKRMDKNRSKAFVRLTRTKIKAMDSRLMDMMFPAGGDKNWAISPVPVSPKDEQMISKVAASVIQKQAMEAKQAIAAAASQPPQQAAPQPGAAAPAQPQAQEQPGAVPAAQDATTAATPAVAPAAQPTIMDKIKAAMPWFFGGPTAMAAEIDAVTDAALDATFQEAKDRCLRMEKVIESQLDSSHYADKCRAAIHSGNLYGTGVLKGPLVEVRNQGQWANSAGTGFEYKSQAQTSPYLEFVSLWDIYPDMNGMTPEQLEHIIQRHVMLPSDLRALAKRDDFRGSVITQYLAENRDGDVETLFFESAIREINGKTTSTKTRGRRYEVLEYWGYVDGRDLQDAGVDVPDDQLDQEFEANVWTLGNQVIKAVLNPFDAGVRPYHFYYFEKDDTSIFGVGIAEIMRDTQAVFNAAIRAAIDNSAMAAGPMFEVNRSLLVPGEDVDTIIPFRIFERQGDGQNPSVRVIQVPNNLQSLMALAQAFKQFGDEATTIPAYTQGEPAPGTAKTVGGLSMLMGAANITIKDTVKNFDAGITEPVIRATYHWNMQFNPDNTIKGNYDIAARGASSLVAKEVRAQQLESLAGQTLNPQDSILINRRNLLMARFRNLDLSSDDLIYTQDEVQQNLEQAQANRPPDPAVMKIALEQAELKLKTLIEEGELQVKERAQTLKEQAEAWAQKMAEADKALEQIQLRVNA